MEGLIRMVETEDGLVGLIICEEVDFMFREVKPVLGLITEEDEVELCFRLHTSPKFGRCFILYKILRNGEVYTNMTGEELESRRILIHPGNEPTDSAGCLLPGKLEERTGKPFISQSRLAMDKLIAENSHITLKLRGSYKL